MRHLLHTVRALTLGVLLVLTARAAEPAKKSYDLPAGDAVTRLKQFAEASGRETLFAADAVRGVRTTAVKGEFTPKEALDRMLDGTGLVSLQDEKTGALAIRRDAGPNAPRVAPEEATTRNDQSKVEEGKLVLDKFEVFGTKSINLDLPRTRDDAQPYVVFGREQIDTSQAKNLEDFFRMRLPMSTTIVGSDTFGQSSFTSGSVNLRGLGTNQTLILVDGRRLPGVGIAGASTVQQPNLSGIPLSMIERIEVLPSTASGIYGGSATGGVINIITRKDYSGADLALSYYNAFDTDAARRQVDLNYSTSLRGGATQITLTASHQDGNYMLAQDRDFLQRARQVIMANNPAAVTSAATPPRGYTTNIRSQNGSNLVLKPQYGGTALGSFYTSVPVGYAGIASDNAAALVANAGRYNLDLPDDPRAGRRELVSPLTVDSLGLSLRQKIAPWLEGYADLQWSRTQLETLALNSFPVSATLAATAPTNPFTVPVTVSFSNPMPVIVPNSWFDQRNTRVAAGLIAKLPREWQAGLDYTWGITRSHTRTNMPWPGDPDGAGPSISYTTAIATGVLNVLRDLNREPLDWKPYDMSAPFETVAKSFTRSLNARASGPVFRIPTGDVVLSASAEWRTDWTAPSVSAFQNIPVPPRVAYQFAPEYSTEGKSGYVETRVPLWAAASPAQPARLELQLAARYDASEAKFIRDVVSTGVPGPDGPFPTVPMASREFHATSYTAGLRFTPVPDLVLRASYGTGFLAPNASQMNSGSVNPGVSVTGIIDPKRGGVPATIGPVNLRAGGNPNLEPEQSQSYSGGAIFTPRFLPGFRLSVDYTRIEKTDEISSLSRQQQLDYEDLLPAGSVVRAPLTPADQAAGYTGGVITEFGNNIVNVSKKLVEAVDFQADYTRRTSLGEFRVYTVATWNRFFGAQFVPNTTMVNQVGTLFSPLKWRGNLGVDWTRGRWSAGWNTQYYASQFLYGGINSTPAQIATAILNNGTDRYPAQFYHDLLVGYQFGHHGEGWRRVFSDVKLSVGVQNLFNHYPPPLASMGDSLGFQGIDDPRLRRYSISIKKHF